MRHPVPRHQGDLQSTLYSVLRHLKAIMTPNLILVILRPYLETNVWYHGQHLQRVRTAASLPLQTDLEHRHQPETDLLHQHILKQVVCD